MLDGRVSCCHGDVLSRFGGVPAAVTMLVLFFLLDVQLQKPREDESIKDTVLLTTSEFVSRRRSGSKRVVRVRF